MVVGQVLAFALFAVAAAVTPGPSNLILASTGAAVGLLRGLPALVGQVAGMGLMLFLVAVGLGSLVLRSPLILQGFKWCGIMFLLWLAWKTATATHSYEATARTLVGFWKMVAFQWVNPKAWLVCAGAVGAYFQAGAGGTLSRSLTLALIFVLVAFPSCFIWLAAGASLQRLLRDERAARVFNLTMGGLLAGSILLFIH